MSVRPTDVRPSDIYLSIRQMSNRQMLVQTLCLLETEERATSRRMRLLWEFEKGFAENLGHIHSSNIIVSSAESGRPW